MIDEPAFLSDLKNLVLKNPSSIIPFVGAGFTRFGASKKNRLPLWQELVESLIDFASDIKEDEVWEKSVTEAINSSNYASALSLIHSHIGPVHFRHFVSQQLSQQKEISPAILEFILIEWSLIVTTNLDDYIEQAYEQEQGYSPKVVTNRQREKLTKAFSQGSDENHPILAKIHGSLDDYASWCLTKHDYQKLITDVQFMDILKTLFMKKILFIGFGLKDDDFDLIQDYLETIYSNEREQSFAILPDTQKDSKKILKLIDGGLIPIYYPEETANNDDPWGGHKGMYDCIKVLAQSWCDSKSNLIVIEEGLNQIDSQFIGRKKSLDQITNYVIHNKMSIQVTGFGGEGKTSLVQEWLNKHNQLIDASGFNHVFGYSFYNGTTESFILKAYQLITGDNSIIDVPSILLKFTEYIENESNKILFFLDGLELILNEERSIDDLYLPIVLE